MPRPVRVAYTLEQCWHDVPGGSATSALAVARQLSGAEGLELLGVAGRHRRPPRPPFEPSIQVHALPIGRPWLYEAWNRWEWPRVERAVGQVGVCHSTVAIPAATAAAHVVTVHDVAFVHSPQRFTAHGVRVMQAGLERCRRADLVLAPSQATADDLAALGFDHDRIRVVPWGVDPNHASPDDVERVRRRYRLPDRFVLFVGTVEPRKNLARLADAVGHVSPPIDLVVAGAEGWGDAHAAADRSPRSAVRFVGFVPAADLPALYRAASVFAYPSLQEGFGMPITEAMAAGIPVVTSAGSATEEVAGGAAQLVDPTSTDSIAAGLAAALADAERLAAAGLARVATMSWAACAGATLAAYREVAP